MSRKYDASRRRKAAENTRGDILQAALKLHWQGVTGFEPLAREAGCSLATLRKHFPNREALFQGCTHAFAATLELPDLEALAAIDDPAQRLARTVAELCRINPRGAVRLRLARRAAARRIPDPGRGDMRTRGTPWPCSSSSAIGRFAARWQSITPMLRRQAADPPDPVVEELVRDAQPRKASPERCDRVVEEGAAVPAGEGVDPVPFEQSGERVELQLARQQVAQRIDREQLVGFGEPIPELGPVRLGGHHEESPPPGDTGKNDIPSRYNAESELEANVEPGENVFDFDLKS